MHTVRLRVSAWIYVCHDHPERRCVPNHYHHHTIPLTHFGKIVFSVACLNWNVISKLACTEYFPYYRFKLVSFGCSSLFQIFCKQWRVIYRGESHYCKRMGCPLLCLSLYSLFSTPTRLSFRLRKFRKGVWIVLWPQHQQPTEATQLVYGVYAFNLVIIIGFYKGTLPPLPILISDLLSDVRLRCGQFSGLALRACNCAYNDAPKQYLAELLHVLE